MSRKPIKRSDRNKAWRGAVRQGSPTRRTAQMTRHLIVTEGTKTEPKYFDKMRDLLGDANGRKVDVVVRGTGRHTMDLLEYAQESCRASPNIYDHVWLVYDKDNFSDEEFDRVAACCAQTRELATYHALWSNPCFELWLLAHLRYTTAPMDSHTCCNTLNDVFKKEFGISYSKSMDGVFDMLAGLRGAAMDNVARLRRHHAGIGNKSPSSQRPCTNVGALFDVMDEFLPLGGGGSGIGSR